MDHAEREIVARAAAVLGCQRAADHLRGVNARRPFGSGGAAKLEAVPETGKRTLRSGSDRPLLTVVDGEGQAEVTPTDARARFAERMASLFEHGAESSWATPAEREAWTQAALLARRPVG